MTLPATERNLFRDAPEDTPLHKALQTAQMLFSRDPSGETIFLQTAMSCSDGIPRDYSEFHKHLIEAARQRGCRGDLRDQKLTIEDLCHTIWNGLDYNVFRYVDVFNAAARMCRPHSKDAF